MSFPLRSQALLQVAFPAQAGAHPCDARVRSVLGFHASQGTEHLVGWLAHSLDMFCRELSALLPHLLLRRLFHPGHIWGRLAQRRT